VVFFKELIGGFLKHQFLVSIWDKFFVQLKNQIK